MPKQKDLAEILEVTPRHLSRILNGVGGASPSLSRRLETVTGVPQLVWLNAHVENTTPKQNDVWKKYVQRVFKNRGETK